MSNFIGNAFKEEIKRSNFTYEKVAEMLDLGTKQNVYLYLTKRGDKDWTYYDVKRFCRLLGINHILFLQDVDRKERFAGNVQR